MPDLIARLNDPSQSKKAKRARGEALVEPSSERAVLELEPPKPEELATTADLEAMLEYLKAEMRHTCDELVRWTAGLLVIHAFVLLVLIRILLMMAVHG